MLLRETRRAAAAKAREARAVVAETDDVPAAAIVEIPAAIVEAVPAADMDDSILPDGLTARRAALYAPIATASSAFGAVMV